jgi:uncharacterized membrane protein YdbT with pleckstrin-like domain
LGYIENNLIPGEQVIYKTGYHWIVMFWSLLASIVLDALGIVSLIRGLTATDKSSSSTVFAIAGIAALVLSSIILVNGIIRRRSTEIAVSNKRVLIKTGIVARKSIEVLLAKVESIGVDETVLGRMLGFGTVVVRGTGGTFETFERISHPDEFRRQVQAQIGTSE